MSERIELPPRMFAAGEEHVGIRTAVDCIIPDDGEEELDETVLGWPGEIKDSKVDNMMRLINEEKTFCSSMFIGGATKADVVRIIKEAKEKNA
ncbi:unnamed protein product [Arabis nemorensis]|uniref:Uncharacterized protein n=1 Tax=Arabis nemorensis TaxID=586526 RepID=A0A565BHZ1_9BRAS|nr:unnamed protein product [Arabis nemorensis]